MSDETMSAELTSMALNQVIEAEYRFALDEEAGHWWHLANEEDVYGEDYYGTRELAFEAAKQHYLFSRAAAPTSAASEETVEDMAERMMPPIYKATTIGWANIQYCDPAEVKREIVHALSRTPAEPREAPQPDAQPAPDAQERSAEFWATRTADGWPICARCGKSMGKHLSGYGKTCPDGKGDFKFAEPREQQALRAERNAIADDSTANAMRVVELQRELAKAKEGLAHATEIIERLRAQLPSPKEQQ